MTKMGKLRFKSYLNAKPVAPRRLTPEREKEITDMLCLPGCICGCNEKRELLAEIDALREELKNTQGLVDHLHDVKETLQIRLERIKL
jgi:hypothetical protein